MRFILLFAFYFSFINLSSGQWLQTNGPFGGGGNDLIEIESNLILSSELNGINKSVDNGMTWQQSNEGLPCDPLITKLVEENDFIYVTVSGNGVYVSEDLGESWRPINNGIETMTFYSLFVSDSNIYAGAANGGVFYSPDNGQNWFNRSDGVSNERIQDIYQFNSKIYIAGEKLHETNDNGINWTLVDIPNLNSNGIRSMTSKDGIFYGFSDGIAYISDDNLISWNNYTIDNQGATIKNSFVHDDKVYITTSLGRYFSTDGDGDNWELVENTDTNSFVEDLLFYDDKIFMALSDGLYFSTDDAESWQLQDENIISLSISTLVGNDLYLFSGTSSNGLFRTADEGESWIKINSVPNEVNDSAANDNYVFTATQSGVYVSEDNGNTFNLKLEPDDINHSVQSISYDDTILVASIGGEGVYKSIDYGNTWVLTETNGINTNTSYNSTLIHQNLIFVSTVEGEIFRSDDLGNSWIEITITGPYSDTYDLKYVENTLYASTSRGLKTSNDLGLNWESFNDDTEPVTDIAISSEKIYASTPFGVKIASLDDKIWYPLCAGIGEQYIPKLFIQNESIFAGTIAKGVYKKPIVEGPLTTFRSGSTLITNSLNLCPSDEPVDLFSLTGISTQSTGEWSPNPSEDGVFDPLVDKPGIYTYTFNEKVCGCDNSINVEINLQEDSNAGNDTTVSLCKDSDPIHLLDYLEGSPDSNGEWSPSLSSGSDLFDTSVDTSTIYTYTVTSGTCGVDSAEIRIDLIDRPNSGSDASVSVCSNDSDINLFEILEGDPDPGGTWSPKLSSGTGYFNPSVDQSGIYTYSVGDDGCESNSEVEVTNIESPNAGADSEMSLCFKSSPVDLFDYLKGNPDEDGYWFPELTSGTSVFDPNLDTHDMYTYTVDSFCGESSASIQITLTGLFEIEDYELTTTELSESNLIRIDINEEGDFEYSLDGVFFQKHNEFSNIESGDHTVYAREKNGCRYLEKELYILNYPKFFTPNGDGLNDVWQLKGVYGDIYKIRIFDRYGKLLKLLSNNNPFWDGKYNGKPMPTSDYWFRLTLNDGRTQTGHFTLKR